MSNVVPLPASRSSEKRAIADLPAQDAALFLEMQAKWGTRRRSKRHTPAAIGESLAVIRNLATYSGKPPWQWSAADFESWSDHLGTERKLAMSTQRKYQAAVRTFMEYLVGNAKYASQVHQSYGVRLRQICTRDNCVPHLLERETTKERLALTHAEVSQLFDALDEGIRTAAMFNGKDFWPLKRDKVMFALLYYAGLRISEAINLNTDSFLPNPDLPALGDIGLIHVWGKGANGSGPRLRIVPVTHPRLTQLLTWYLLSVRPHFLVHADPNDSALFFSERGRRIAISSAEARFQHAMRLSDLEDKRFTPHCLRHSSVTHESLRFDLETVRRKHGHTFAATTQNYMHIPDEYVREDIQRGVSGLIDQSVNSEPKP